MGVFCILLQGVSRPHEAPSFLAFLYRARRTLVAYVDEASSPSSACATTCSKLIAFLSPRLCSKRSSLNCKRLVAIVLSLGGGGGLVIDINGRLGPKNLFDWQANNFSDRLTGPLVRGGGRLVETDRDTAMGRVECLV